MFGFSNRPKTRHAIPNAADFKGRRTKRLDARDIPEEGLSGADLIEGVRVETGRRAILQTGGRVQQVERHRHYRKKELLDKLGRPAKITTMPDRSKGGGFEQGPSSSAKALIREQVYAVADHIFHQPVAFDEEEARWMVVPNYRLPKRWHHVAAETPLMVVFPDEYPILPPVGFYMRADIHGHLDGHFVDGTYHNAWKEPLEHGWKWYCVFIHAGAWRPAREWRHGDNLFTYFQLIAEALQQESD